MKRTMTASRKEARFIASMNPEDRERYLKRFIASCNVEKFIRFINITEYDENFREIQYEVNIPDEI